MRKTLCASVLVLALCGSAFAGDAGCPPAPGGGDIQNPPSASQTADEVMSDPTADMTAGSDSDVLAAAALSAINSVLALL